MGKRLVVVVVLAIGLGSLSAAAMPHWIGDRIVDKIMNWGDKHNLAPFKKGGGDEAATRKLISDLIVMPVEPWRVMYDLSIGSESKLQTIQQGKPGSSQEQGVPMPSGAHQQTPIGQPADRPTLGSRPDVAPFEGGIARGQGPATPTQATSNAGGGTNTQAPLNRQQTLTLYKNKEGYQTTTNPNQPAALAQAVAQPAPQPTPAAAPQPAAPAEQSRPERSGGGPMGGAQRVDQGGRTGGTPSDKGAIESHAGTT